MMGLLGAMASGFAGTKLAGIQEERKKEAAVDLMQLEHSLDMQLKEIDQGYKAEGKEQSHNFRMEELEYSADRQDARAAATSSRQDARAAARASRRGSGKKEWIKETIVGEDGGKRTVVTGYYDDAGFHPMEGGAAPGVGAAPSAAPQPAAAPTIEERMEQIWGERPSQVKKESKSVAAAKPRNTMETEWGEVAVKPQRGAR